MGNYLLPKVNNSTLETPSKITAFYSFLLNLQHQRNGSVECHVLLELPAIMLAVILHFRNARQFARICL